MRFTIFLILSSMVMVSCSEQEMTKQSDLERRDGMVYVPGGTYKMGSTGEFNTPYGMKRFPEEAPIRTVVVKPFWIDETEVTNDQFTAFVKETGYQTYAEREAKKEDFPEETWSQLPPFPFKNGSIVFSPPPNFDGDVNEQNAVLSWWRWDAEANWKQPSGKESSIVGMGKHPVVCVTHGDATAYAKWAGKRLPTEAEWEFAARGGLVGKMYAWGDELKPGDQWMANTFQGDFPDNDSAADGYASTAPVKSYPSNGYGLYDMSGNVWEICEDFYDPEYPAKLCGDDPKGPETWVNRESGKRGQGAVHHVTKGGSFLCHISYCMRYRPAARHSIEDGSPSSHTGFRLVRD